MCYEIKATEKSWQNMLHKNPENHPVRVKLRTLKCLKAYQELPPFGKFVTEVLILRNSRSLMFFKISVLINFTTITGKHLCWPFFCRTPAVATPGFSSAESGIYCKQSHRVLLRIPFRTGVKSQKQPLELFCKIRCSKKFFKFHRKAAVLKSLFNRVTSL